MAQATRLPAKVRQREAARRLEIELADSFIDEKGGMLLRRAGTLADSSESDEFKESSILDHDSNDSGDFPRNSSQPKLSMRGVQRQATQDASNSFIELGINSTMPSAIVMMAETMRAAIHDENWDRLGMLCDGMHEQKLRFDEPVLKQYPAVQQIVESVPVTLLARIEDAAKGDDEKMWLLALDFVDLGCDRNAKDLQGNTVIDLLLQKANPALTDLVLSERPDLKDFLEQT